MSALPSRFDPGRLHVRLYLSVGTDRKPYHHSYVYTGLFALAARGRIELETQSVEGSPWWYWCVRLDIARMAEPSLVVAIDLADKSTWFQPEALQDADLYFKRSYYTPDVEALPRAYKRKVVPWGLNYPTRSVRSARAVLGMGLRETLRAQDMKTRRDILRNVFYYMRLNPPHRFFHPASAPKKTQVLFQTRVWTEEELGTDADEAVNECRAEMVRALKREFGERFVGGLVPNDLARSRYPDLLSEQPSRQSRYLALLKDSLIGVYTRGLHHSTAWKLPEYLSASMCVVAEPIRNRLQDPMVAEDHYLEYVTPEECTEACVRIFENPALQDHLRRRAEGYYWRSIEPESHMERCLSAAERLIGTDDEPPADGC